MHEKGQEYECDLIPLIVYVPNNTVALDLYVTVMEEDKSIQHAVNSMSIADLYEARVDGEYWEAKNAKYTITDKGRELLGNGGNIEEVLNK